MDLTIRESILRGSPYKLILPAPEELVANKFLLNLYSEYLTISSSVFINLLIMPLANNPFLRITTHRFCPSSKSSYHKRIWNKYDSVYRKPLIQFPEAKIEECEKELAKIGFRKGARFVGLHVRDSGFYKDLTRVTRNGNIQDYREGITFLIDRGITVLRLGCKDSADFSFEYESQESKFIDYSKSGVVSDMLDCFIWSQGEFFLGSASGPANVPSMFGRSGCYTNIYPYNSCFWFHKNDITIVKPLYNIRSQEYLSLTESFKHSKYYDPASTSALREQGLELHFNTSEEILSAFREFLNCKEKNTVKSPEQQGLEGIIDDPQRFWSFGGPGRVSTDFIKKYSIVKNGPFKQA
ncbi:MAG: TIGR04372 family glycosyltransferase [Limisphaerales bacterium]